MNKEERKHIISLINKMKPLHKRIASEVKEFTREEAIAEFGNEMDWQEVNKIPVGFSKDTKPRGMIYQELNAIMKLYKKTCIETKDETKKREDLLRRHFKYYQQKHYQNYLQNFARYPDYYIKETAKRFYETGEGVVNYAFERIRFAVHTI